MYRTTINTPVGNLNAFASDSSITGLLWPSSEVPAFGDAAKRVKPDSIKLFAELSRQLAEYFDGTRKRFEIALDLIGTEFQLSVWQALRDIPFGETRTYAQQATIIGRPKSVRAVGAANGKNPISIIVPCHRVIGSNGNLTGFAGGLETKRILLEHESLASNGKRKLKLLDTTMPRLVEP